MLQMDAHRTVWFETAAAWGEHHFRSQPACPTPTLPVSDFQVLSRCFSPFPRLLLHPWVGGQTAAPSFGGGCFPGS